MLYFLHSTSVLSFHTEVFLTLSIGTILTPSHQSKHNPSFLNLDEIHTEKTQCKQTVWYSQPTLPLLVSYDIVYHIQFHWNKMIDIMLMIKWHKEPGHQQAWYWPGPHKIFCHLYWGGTEAKSISWLLMPWLIRLPGYHHAWWQICRINRSLFSMREHSYIKALTHSGSLSHFSDHSSPLVLVDPVLFSLWHF